jgi:hypothetical protein
MEDLDLSFEGACPAEKEEQNWNGYCGTKKWNEEMELER